MSTSEIERTTSKKSELLAIAALIAERFHVLQPPSEWDSGPGGGGDLDCWIRGLDPQWPLRLPPEWRLVQALQDRFSRWQWWLEGPHGKEIIDTTEDPNGLETGIGRRAMEPAETIEAPPVARAIYLTQKRLYKGFDQARWQEIAPLAAHDPALYRRVLQDVFGKRVGQRLARAGLRGVPPDAQLHSSYKRAHKLQWTRHPIDGLVYALLGAKRRIKRTLLPTGLMVLVVGPDGSGKSTFAQEFLEDVGTLFRRRLHAHWRPSVLPPIARLLGRPSSDVTRPHGQERHSVIASYAALAYYWLDNLIGGWTKLRNERRRTGLVVIERGWWDIAIDPGRYRMRVGPRIVRVLGSLLPRPDVIFVLDGPSELFEARKRELPAEEIARQLHVWHEVAPKVGPTVYLDASRAVEMSVAEAREWVVQKLEARTAARIGPGWLALPPSDQPRFALPRGPASAAVAGLRIYHPMTSKGRVTWEAARLVGKVGGLRLTRRGQAPPHEVREILSNHVPRGGTVSLQRANHKDRWVALVINANGQPHRLVKLSTANAGSPALQREAENIERFAGHLVSPLLPPRLLEATANALIFEPVDWLPRRRPWHLPPDIAYAIGCLARTEDDRDRTVAHGDFAPWNLLRTRKGWVLIDWEAGGSGYPPMFDLWHHIVQSHALLGRPTQAEIESALDRRPTDLTDAISGFVSGAGSDWGSVRETFERYLQVSRKMFDPALPQHQVALEARDRLSAER